MSLKYEPSSEPINSTIAKDGGAGPKTWNNKIVGTFGVWRGDDEGLGVLTPCSSPQKSWETRGVSCQRCILPVTLAIVVCPGKRFARWSSGRLKFTVRRHKFNKDAFSSGG